MPSSPIGGGGMVLKESCRVSPLRVEFQIQLPLNVKSATLGEAGPARPSPVQRASGQRPISGRKEEVCRGCSLQGKGSCGSPLRSFPSLLTLSLCSSVCLSVQAFFGSFQMFSSINLSVA